VQLSALDDFDDPTSGAGCGGGRTRSLIACIGEDAQDDGEQGARAFIKNECCAVTILNVGRVNGGAQQQAERIYENVALLALDLLARIVAMRINARPPFSALFTLWLSMMAAVGLTSRSPRSLHRS
jgi:hypothetical protein